MENENEILNKKLEYIKGFAYLANIFLSPVYLCRLANGRPEVSYFA
jgi:hypothetical protein